MKTGATVEIQVKYCIFRKFNVKKLFVLLTSVCLIAGLIRISIYEPRKFQLEDLYYNLMDQDVSPFCSIPKLDPFDSEMMKYLKYYPRLKCERIQPELFRLEKGSLLINQGEYRAITTGGSQHLECQFRCIKKHTDDCQFQLDDWIDIDLKSGSIAVQCEAFQVRCQLESSMERIYENFFYQILPDVNIQRKFSLEHSTAPNHSKQPKRQNLPNSDFAYESKPNFVVVVIDSMSRSHLIRALPKTYEFLTRKLGALDFLGVNKVGDNTSPNIAAALAGVRWGEEADGRYNMTYFDDWPLLWKNFTDAGYATLYGEDFPQYNTFHSYAKRGFQLPVTHHYMRPFWLAAQGSFVRRWSSPNCFGTVPTHRVLTDAVLDLFKAYPPNQPKFAVIQASEISHQDFSDVTQSDDDWLEFLQAMQPHLNNSFLFLFGDHGYRYGDARQSLVGQIEGRMPAFFMTMPKWFREKWPRLAENAELNSRERLVTMFDFHATGLYIARELWNNHSSSQRNKINKISYGIPFFDPIPENRTCEEAPIPPEFCICQQSKPVPLNDTRVKQATNELVWQINHNILGKYSHKCAHLVLQHIKMATVILPNKRMLFDDRNQTDVHDISITFDLMIQVAPSDAVLQAKVRHIVEGNSFSIVGTVERLNLYGNQSACISSDSVAQLYCYCV